MSQLTRTTWDSTYNNNSSGPFKTNSTQAITEPVMQAFSKDAEDSLAFLTDVNQFLSKQNIGITSAGVVADASILGLKSYFQTSDASIFHINGYFQTQQNVATANSIQGLEAYTTCVHPSGTVALAIGLIGNIEMASAFTLTTARSVQAGGQSSATGTVTEWDLFYGSLANSASATYTTVVGLKIDTFPTATNKYGIVIVDPLGKNGFGQTSPTAIIDITASTTSIASLRVRHGSAPTTPNDGDIWTTTSGAFARINGTTINLGSGVSGLTTGAMPYATSSTTLADSEISRLASNNYRLLTSINGSVNFFTYNSLASGSGAIASIGAVVDNSSNTIQLTVFSSAHATAPYLGLLDVGNGNSALLIRSGSGNIGFTNSSSSFLTPSRTLHPFFVDGANASTVGYVQRWTKAFSSGTPAIGVGTGVEFETSTALGVYKIGSTIESISTNITGGAQSFDLVIKNMNAGAAASEKMRITGAGNIYGTSGSTGMTDGFFYIPSAAGAPSGTPTSISAHVPMYYDTTNNKFYIYNGAWKQVVLT